MRNVLALGLVMTLASVAGAQMLYNGDMETQVTGPYSGIDGWGPSGSWAPHANHANGGYDALIHGDNFGYYSAQGTETVGQVTSYMFEPETEYTFGGWFTGGGNDVGNVVLQIGYDDAGTFMELDTLEIVTGADWVEYPGLTYTTGLTGLEIGMPIWVRLGDGVDGPPGDSDIWFDNLVLTPEPAGLLVLALGALLRRR
jgi:hypothetical protein